MKECNLIVHWNTLALTFRVTSITNCVIKVCLQWQRSDRSSALLLPFSWERLQGSISQPAITCSQKQHLATYLWSSRCPFNAIQQLLTTVAAVSLPRATKMRVFVCLNARWLSHSTKCNDWVWSLTLNRVAE